MALLWDSAGFKEPQRNPDPRTILAEGIRRTGDFAQSMASKGKNRGGLAAFVLDAGLLVGVLALIGNVADSSHAAPPDQATGATGTTTLRITDQVMLPHVTRLGINLGEQTYYDSGQMVRNLLYRNPGFEGMTYRSILHCLSAGPANCTDTRHSFTWPAGFWDGATYEVLDGAATGRRGTVKSSAPANGGYSLNLDSSGPAIAPGDWLAVSKSFPGDPAAGWWPKVSGGARIEPERRDLSPETQGTQALRIEAAEPGQSAELKSYLDSLEGFTFVRLHGHFRLTFRAKGLAGNRTVHVHLRRIANGHTDYFEQDFQLTPSWADYHADFTADEGPLPVGPIDFGFNVQGASLLLDDVDIEQTGGDPQNHTAFRDEVLQTLRDLHPGVLRLMSGHAQLGSTVNNLLAPPLARQRPGFSTWMTTMEDIPVGIPEFLELCREVGAEPWIVVPTAMSADEARTLAQYFSAGSATPGGALRAAAGHHEPWTTSFKTIHIELGNETWNSIFSGEALDDSAAYGRRADRVFRVFRAAAGADTAKFDLVVGGQAANPWRGGETLKNAPAANSLAIAPYLMHSVTQWANDDQLYGPLLAQPEQMSADGIVQAAAATAAGRQLAVYEVNLHTTEGTAPRDVLDRLTPSAAAGVAVTGHMLRMMRDHLVRDEMLFSLPQFSFRRSDGTPVRLWGSVVQMGAEGRARPQLLAESIANNAIRGDLVRVETAGDNPTHNQPEGNDQVHLTAVHEIDSYAFKDGNIHSLIVFNYGLHQSRRIHIQAPGLKPSTSAKLWRLVSPGPGATNEDTVQVTVKEERLQGTEVTIAPCSIVAIEWTE